MAITAPRHDDALVARNTLDRGLEGLSVATRSTVLLHHLHGWSFEEIAKRMGINNAAARLRASRGLSALRTRLLGGHGDDDA
jgi:DNA-directed RNA polymerase specialized sigma24 family protein